MREAHITFDGRSGLFDPQPLRTFTVYQMPTVAVRNPPVIEVKANIANQLESGALAFLTLKGGLPFTTRAFAAGQWANFEGSVPSEDEVRQIKSFSERERAISQMLIHDAEATHQ